MRHAAPSIWDRLARVALCVAIVGCSDSSVVPPDAGPPEPPDAATFVLGPGGARGVCCPSDPPSCACVRTGGWAPALGACPTRGPCNVANWNPSWDPWGCPILVAGAQSCTPRPSPVSVGGECTPERGCPTADAACLHPDNVGPEEHGGPSDPIVDHPDGEDTVVTRDRFPDGMCTLSYPGRTPVLCDPVNPEAVCGFGADCLVLDVGPVCFRRCDPSVLPRDDCREGYRCEPEVAVCMAGCQSDAECRIARRETNGLAGLQLPELCEADPDRCTPTDCGAAEPSDPDACANPADNFDRLVYDNESTAICDLATLRCT